MASPGMNTGYPQPDQTTAAQYRMRIEHALRGSASWFIAIAALSILNSILSMTGTNVRFIFGMGITQVVDELASRAGSAGILLNLVINGMIAGVFVLFWHFARKGQKWAWIVGMGLYVIDGLLLLLVKDYLSVAFHAYALFRMSFGFKLLSALESLRQQEATGAISSTM